MGKIIIDIFKHKSGKLILPFFILSFCGLVIEVFVRAISGSLVGFINLKYISLMGYTSLWMIPVYGLGSLVISIINEFPKYFKLKMIYQTLIGGFCIILIEYLFGIVLNIIFKLNVWDYGKEYLNLSGQICLITSIEWILATPLFIFICDYVGWCLYRENEEWHYSIFRNYIDLFTNK